MGYAKYDEDNREINEERLRDQKENSCCAKTAGKIEKNTKDVQQKNNIDDLQTIIIHLQRKIEDIEKFITETIHLQRKIEDIEEFITNSDLYDAINLRQENDYLSKKNKRLNNDIDTLKIEKNNLENLNGELNKECCEIQRKYDKLYPKNKELRNKLKKFKK